ncbi:RHS repeat-associated core domain-containing protein [Corallococcus aberystwythensis]|uniref:RHS repeat-associated core domain-containing protein n=2 Tax=Corallococcus aberystwythensis TaxID=2316722 RepID=A0A3A8QX98_9BACT|nr:RHS repeat-associated core domain-containing protein [Corallococcus aberystwythensis]
MSVTPPGGQYKETNFTYDADGRAVTKEQGHYVSGQPANLMEFRYAPFSASEGQGSARESVFRAVRVNGMTYNYFYDALGRRRAKVNPFNQRDEFFHGTGNELLVDQGWNEVYQLSQGNFRVVDDYIWLGGRPVMIFRGRLDATQNVREPDSTVDCRRDGEAAACGVYFPVTDILGKPVLMLNGDGLVAGAADYQPFGHVNRLSTPDSSALPFSDEDGESFSGFQQAAENSNVQVRARARFLFIDLYDDEVSVVRNDDSTLLTTYSDWEMDRVVTPWFSMPAEGINVNISAGPLNSSGPNTHTGAAMEGYEYQRYQTGAQPFWTPLRFAGHYYDAETDLFENWNRYYDPSVGRYLQPEPMLGWGPSALPAYAYALNNPMAYADPNGNDPIGLSPVPYLAGLLSKHYGRNARNQTVPYADLAANNWHKMSAAESVFHRMRAGNENNEKYISSDGKCEAVYKDGKLVTDPLNVGTYNYIAPVDDLGRAGHGLVDVLPYFIYGNTPYDMFTLDRFWAPIGGLF